LIFSRVVINPFVLWYITYYVTCYIFSYDEPFVKFDFESCDFESSLEYLNEEA
jgi:hypothetical protein